MRFSKVRACEVYYSQDYYCFGKRNTLQNVHNSLIHKGSLGMCFIIGKMGLSMKNLTVSIHCLSLRSLISPDYIPASLMGVFK